MLVAHGYNKVFGRAASRARPGGSTRLGLQPAHVHARLAAATELGAGALITLGAASPLPAAAAIGLMTTAARTDHRGKGFFMFRNGWEYVGVVGAVAAAMAALGPGRYSVDHLLGRERSGLRWAPGRRRPRRGQRRRPCWRPATGPTASARDPPESDGPADPRGRSRSPLEAGGRVGGDHPPGEGALPRRRGAPSWIWPATTWRSSRPSWPAMGGRPVLLQRFPHGAGGPSFFQKRVPRSGPDWLETTIVATPNGTTSRALVAADLAHVLWAVNLACLGFHVWPYRADDPEHADELRIDLDPTPGVDFEMVREAAHEVDGLLRGVGLTGWPKTTGNRGIHVYVRLLPRWSSIEVRAAAVAVARELERRRPDLITAAWWKEERGRRVFVDFNQNAPHKTVFGAWSVRARPGAQVSTPFGWEELAGDPPGRADHGRRSPSAGGRSGDPWAGAEPQSLEPLLEMSRRDAAAGLLDAPWPPVYPKMPGEPPRVAPSRARKTP